MTAMEPGPTELGLPLATRACLFDLDGVLTDTASAHAAVWKDVLDEYLRDRSSRTGEPFVPFDIDSDYLEHVDGRPRADGVRSFLAARGIALPDGTAGDPPGARTVHGLANRKNERLLERLERDGVDPYQGSVRYLRAVRAARLGTAVVSASCNCRDVLEAAGIGDLFDVLIDGGTADRDQLRGKPAPDTFLAAAHALAVHPAHAAVFEDALAGVRAARGGGFGFVVGVDHRGGSTAQLRSEGADVVVHDLSELMDAR